VIGVVFAVLFARRQFRLSDPLLDLRLFKNRIFSNSLVIMLVGSFLMSGMMLLFIQYLQLVKGLSPLRAGLYMIATSVAMVIGIMLAPFISRLVRPGYVIAIGLAVAVVGLSILTQVDTTTGVVFALAGPVITNLGVGPFVTLATELVQGAVPPEKAGSAGAVSQTSGEGGVALGLAALGGIGLAVYGSKIIIPAGIPAGPAAAAKESIAGAAVAATRLPAAQAHALYANAQAAFTSALNIVAIIVAILAALLAIVAATMLRDARRPGEGMAMPEADESAEKAPIES
jgi:DHA2 family multidrug resistance protein-like MFS transporter